MRGYLTPDSIPPGITCRVLFIPDDRDWVAQVYGAIEVLTFPGSWTQYGALTPEETAAVYEQMFFKLLDNERGCRMVGELITWAGGAPPSDPNLLLCDGTEYERADYPALYAILDSAFIVDADHFITPDLQGRVVIGSSVEFNIGDSGGETDHTLTTAEMPSHDHTTDPHSHTDTGHVHALAGEVPGLALSPGELPVDVPGSGEFTAPGNASITSSGVTVNSTGDGDPHNNMQPYLTLTYYIQAR